jgi:hypothetical protein
MDRLCLRGWLARNVAYCSSLLSFVEDCLTIGLQEFAAGIGSEYIGHRPSTSRDRLRPPILSILGRMFDTRALGEHTTLAPWRSIR